MCCTATKHNRARVEQRRATWGNTGRPLKSMGGTGSLARLLKIMSSSSGRSQVAVPPLAAASPGAGAQGPSLRVQVDLKTRMTQLQHAFAGRVALACQQKQMLADSVNGPTFAPSGCTRRMCRTAASAGLAASRS